MDDGSYLDFHLALSKTVAEAHPQTARTSGGQVIPASPSNAAGEWTSDRDDLGPLADHLAKMGVPVEYAGVARTSMRSVARQGNVSFDEFSADAPLVG